MNYLHNLRQFFCVEQFSELSQDQKKWKVTLINLHISSCFYRGIQYFISIFTGQKCCLAGIVNTIEYALDLDSNFYPTGSSLSFPSFVHN